MTVSFHPLIVCFDLSPRPSRLSQLSRQLFSWPSGGRPLNQETGRKGARTESRGVPEVSRRHQQDHGTFNHG